MLMKVDPLVEKFLRESNAIEGFYTEEAFASALTAWYQFQAKVALNKRIDIQDILDTHKIMCHWFMGAKAGVFRNWQVMIGGSLGAKVGLIRPLMDNWVLDSRKIKNWSDIKSLHIVFEKIHPFSDGNGRIGRILMNTQRVMLGLPILVIYEVEKYSYYKWFTKEKENRK